ncbi:MAG: DUF362 domain-containing protein [Nanoarchaeota archaeon]
MMVNGASIKFKSYQETLPKILDLLKLQRELKKYDKIVIKPFITEESSLSKEFLEPIIKFCIGNKNPIAEVFIAEGADGKDTAELFDSLGYKQLAEKYHLGLIDLNNAETEEIEDPEFLKFTYINYPKILKESFVISVAKTSDNEEYGMNGALSGMLGAFPSSKYSGIFSRKKSKIRKWPIKYSIHDIIRCKMPDFSIIDSSENKVILAGLPVEIEKQAARTLGKDWRGIPYLKLIDEMLIEKNIEIQKAEQNILI